MKFLKKLGNNEFLGEIQKDLCKMFMKVFVFESGGYDIRWKIEEESFEGLIQIVQRMVVMSVGFTCRKLFYSYIEIFRYYMQKVQNENGYVYDDYLLLVGLG